MERVKEFGRYFIWCVAAATLVFCLGSLHLFARELDQISRDLRLDSAPEASLVYDRHNNLVFSFASEDRTNVPLDRVSPRMISAVLTAEDRYFYQHAGMDVIGLARAAWVDLKARAVKQGGSTITQQLIRHVALTTDRNFQRKIKEALAGAARRAPVRQNKILEAYLNRIYLGNGHYGVEAAARGYFAQARLRTSQSRRARCSPASFPAHLSAHRGTSPNVAKVASRHRVESDARERRHHRAEYADAIASSAGARGGAPRPLRRDASWCRTSRTALTRRDCIFWKACGGRSCSSSAPKMC